MLRKLVEDGRCRGDRVTPIEKGKARFFRSSDQSDRCSLIAHDIAISALREGCWLHFIAGAEDLRRITKVVPGLEGLDIRIADFGLLRELPL